jgi:TolB-like protein
MSEDLRGVLLSPDAGAAVSARPMKRLIVLPFRMLKPDAEIDYLSSSLADAISCSLSELGSLLVRSSLTASRYAGPEVDLKQIASEAEVDAVLTGTLLRAGETIRVSTQLVEAPSGTLVWSNTSQVGLDNIFALEESVTTRVVDSLSLPMGEREERILRRDVPASPVAYEFYLRGAQQGHRPEEWRVARDLFQRSVDEDPRYAPAWARLARIQWLIAKYTSDPGDSFQMAEKSLKQSLEINPELNLAHNIQAHIDVSAGRAVEAMCRLLARARLHPSDPELFAGLVLACRFCGLLEASLAAHEQARRLDPGIRSSITHTYFMLGVYEGGLPDAHLDIGYVACLALLMLGRRDEALANLRREQRRHDLTHVQNWVTSLLGFLEGEPDESRAALERLVAHFQDPEGMFYVARTFAFLGDVDRALQVLAIAVERGFSCFPAFARDPWLDALRTRREFTEVLLAAETRHRTALAAFLEEGGERLLGISIAQ